MFRKAYLGTLWECSRIVWTISVISKCYDAAKKVKALQLVTLNMQNCFKEYKICIHILYHILDFVQQKKTKFTMEQPCMLFFLYCQYHGCWCSGYIRISISRHGIDQMSQHIPSLASEELSIWVRSRNCGCLVTWFCYQLIAKPGNKTAAVSWPDPYGIWKTSQKQKCSWYLSFISGM